MARFRRRARRSASPRRSFARSRARAGVSPASVIIPAMIYGGVRAKISALVNQYVPGFLGQYTDEVIMGAAGYWVAKKNTGMLRNLGLAALTIESASVGNQLIAPMVGGSNASTGSSAAQGWV